MYLDHALEVVKRIDLEQDCLKAFCVDRGMKRYKSVCVYTCVVGKRLIPN
jgi:hypothetical protein